MPVLKTNKNGEWIDIASAYTHTHTVSDIADLPASLVNDVEALKDKVGGLSVAKHIDEAIKANIKYTHPDTHPASMITDLHDVATSGDYNDLVNIPTGLATEQYVQDKIAKIPNVDLSDYAKMSDIPDVSNFATETYVQEQIAKIDVSGGVNTPAFTPDDEGKVLSVKDGELSWETVGNSEVVGGASVQADWNQVDDTQLSYIKNKPFGEVFGTTTLVDGSYRYYYDEANEYWESDIIPITSDIHLADGETYIVTWNGDEYVCTAAAFLGTSVVIGNIEALMGEPDGDIPFIIVEDRDNSLENGSGFRFIMIPYPDSTVITEVMVDIKVVYEGVVIKQIDNKYLPILNRIDAYQKDVLPTTEYGPFTLDSNYDCDTFVTSAEYSLTIGETYYVQWGDDVHECVAQDADIAMPGYGLIGLGNCSAIEPSLSGNGENFIIGMIPGAGIIYLAITERGLSNSHTIRIYQTVEESYVFKNEYQPDWEQYDSNRPGFIKNRPFYSLPAGTPVVNNVVINCNSQDTETEYLGFTANKFTIAENDKYDIVFDGVLYSNIAAENDGTNVCLQATSDGGFFYIITTSGMLVLVSSQGEHTISILTAEEFVQKIDPKYLPELSGGSGLPDVTTDHNNNILQVVNGEWKVLSLAESTIANYIDEYIADALGGSY